MQAKIVACQIRLHIIPVNFTEPAQGLRHEEAYSLGNQRDACVTLVEWRRDNRVLFHDSLCIQRKRMETHPIDERAETRKQQRKETHLQQYTRKRKIAQLQSKAKRRKLFTLVDGKIVKIDSDKKGATEDEAIYQSAKCEQRSGEGCCDIKSDPYRPPEDECQSANCEQGSGEGCCDFKSDPDKPPENVCQRDESEQRHEEWFEQQCIQDDDIDPLGLGFELE